VIQGPVDERHHRDLKCIGILALIAAQEPQSDQPIDVRLVQLDSDAICPLAAAPPVKAHAGRQLNGANEEHDSPTGRSLGLGPIPTLGSHGGIRGASYQQAVQTDRG